MAITIDWGNTNVIYVPKVDLTLIQSSPTEIRELNLNWFRLELKALEASVDGMAFPDTHTHNTEVTLGGLTFARVIEILDPYTITFEDGQYAVNLIGANSNVGDKINVNQVSVRSQNSAGLISSPDIEYASFNDGVAIDVNSGYSGTVFPRGTKRMMVDNTTDAILIANYRGLNKLYFYCDYDMDSGEDFSDFYIIGESPVETHINILDSADTTAAIFKNITIGGILDGGNTLENCVIENLSYVQGHISNCGLKGIIILGGEQKAFINNCNQVDINSNPYINMGGSGQDLVVTNYTGKLYFQNLTGGNSIGVGLNAGQVILDSGTVLSGLVQVAGIGTLTDNANNHISTGTWNGGVTIINQLINKEIISEAVWDEPASEHVTADTLAKLISDILEDTSTTIPASISAMQTNITELLGLAGENVKWSDISHDANNLMTAAKITLYTDNTLITPLKSWDVTATYNGDGEITSYQMVEI